jgi:carbonic anhydrase/acetyltransferase-like protein (isoleucine patch superfamily)
MKSSVRKTRDHRPASESLEARLVLAVPPQIEFIHLGLFGSLGSQPARPNTPVAPYGATSTPTFIDPSVTIKNASQIAVGSSDYVAPWASLDARNGLMEIGSKTTIQDNAHLIANPTGVKSVTGIILGDNVYIGAGATIVGPTIIGAPGGAATSIGPDATIDHATIFPGAEVGALAFVGPGVVIPTGFRVLPGATILSQADVANPKLVVKLTGTDTILANQIADNASLANGYTQIYQGVSATGAAALTTASTVFNGNLSTVEGSSRDPGPGTSSSPLVTFEGPAVGPKYTLKSGKVIELDNPFFPEREIGAVTFHEIPSLVQKFLGNHTSIRADEDQPISVGNLIKLGRNMTIHASRGGKITINDALITGDNDVLTADANGNLTVGPGVTLGNNVVQNGSTIGGGAKIGDGSYIADSTIPAGSIIAPGTIEINNKVFA